MNLLNNLANLHIMQKLAAATNRTLTYKPSGVGPFNPAAFSSVYPNPGDNALGQTARMTTIVPTDIRLLQLRK